MNINEAIQSLQTIMKQSAALDNFNHIELRLAPADKKDEYEKALFVLNQAIQTGEYTQADLLKKLKVK